MSLPNSLTVDLFITNADGSVYLQSPPKVSISIPKLKYNAILTALTKTSTNGYYTFSLPDEILTNNDIEDRLSGITVSPKHLNTLIENFENVYLQAIIPNASPLEYELIEEDFTESGAANVQYSLDTNEYSTPPPPPTIEIPQTSSPTTPSYVIKGKIVDSLSGAPIPKATIKYTAETTKSIAVNPLGEFSLSILEEEFNPNFSIQISAGELYNVVTKSNLLQTSSSDNISYYDVGSIKLEILPSIKETFTTKANNDTIQQEITATDKSLKQQLPTDLQLKQFLDEKAKELKSLILPTIINLLLIFGPIIAAQALAGILKKVDLCPGQDTLLKMIRIRNNMMKSLNLTHQSITRMSQIVGGITLSLEVLQIAINIAKAAPYPASGIPAIGLPPLTSGMTTTIAVSTKNAEEAIKRSKGTISLINSSLIKIGIILGVLLKLFGILDKLIEKCSQNQDVPFEAVNTELNTLANPPQNQTQENPTNEYRGFKLEVKIDPTTISSPTPKRFGQALNKQGVPVLKTSPTFANDYQVITDELKFIIDSNPNLTAE
jgi:hypothetical protein